MKAANYIKIRFLKPYPAMVGEDFEIYGPFREEDITFIPKQNAQILIDEKLAKILNDQKP
jgi:DNA replication initiation complex subunit (GINS family)